jgi:hypothetical protein
MLRVLTSFDRFEFLIIAAASALLVSITFLLWGIAWSSCGDRATRLGSKTVMSVVQFQRVSAMRTKILLVLIAVAVTGVSPAAIAKGGGGGGGGGGKGGSGGHVGHAAFHPRFDHRFLRNQFLRNQVLLGGVGGWGWDWGAGYGGGTNVSVSQQSGSAFPAAAVTGSLPPCHWNSEIFNVPSSAGGRQPIEVVSCR